MYITRKKKICKKCKKETYIFSHGLCSSCAPRKPIKKQALKNKPRKATGEAEVFLSIWAERKHICVNCGEFLGDEPLAHFFAHIISKKRAPELRLDASNIFLACWDCHYAYDFRGKEEFEKRKRTV